MTETVNWRASLDDALLEAAGRDLPVLLDFFKPT
jgi:hypothetical protein